MFISYSCSTFDNYPNGPKSIQRQNSAIDEAMKERQKRIDAENLKKQNAENERQKRIAESVQAKNDKYANIEATMKQEYINTYLNNTKYQSALSG
jgi:hypothetical protein